MRITPHNASASEPGVRPWSLTRVIVSSLIVMALFVLVQAIAIAGLLTMRIAEDGTALSASHVESIGLDGHALSVATIASALVCVPLIFSLTRRREPDAIAFLRLLPVDGETLSKWGLGIVACVAAIDGLTLALGRPLVPEFMVRTTATVHPIFFFMALTLAAPIFEEVFFRGFLSGALEASGRSGATSAIVSSAAWAGIHLQYDWFGLLSIFCMGLVLSLARSRTGSVVTCILMHALANAIAFSEAHLLGQPAFCG